MFGVGRGAMATLMSSQMGMQTARSVYKPAALRGATVFVGGRSMRTLFTRNTYTPFKYRTHKLQNAAPLRRGYADFIDPTKLKTAAADKLCAARATLGYVLSYLCVLFCLFLHHIQLSISTHSPNASYNTGRIESHILFTLAIYWQCPQ